MRGLAVQHSRAFTSLAATLTAVLSTGCATTSPGIAYYDMNRPESLRPNDGVNDVFVLDKAILKISTDNQPALPVVFLSCQALRSLSAPTGRLWPRDDFRDPIVLEQVPD